MTIYHVTSRMLGEDLIAMLADRRLLPCSAVGPEDAGCTRLTGHPGMHAAGSTFTRPANGGVMVLIVAAWDQTTAQPNQLNRQEKTHV